MTVVFCDLVGSTARAERLDPGGRARRCSRRSTRVCATSSSAAAARSRSSSATRSWLCSARRSCTRTTPSAPCAPRLRSGSGPPSEGEARGTDRRQHGRGARRARAPVPSAGEAMVAGDVVNTAARLQSRSAGERRPRRRGNAPSDRAGDRVPRARAGRRRRARRSRCRSGRRWRRARASASTSSCSPAHARSSAARRELEPARATPWPALARSASRSSSRSSASPGSARAGSSPSCSSRVERRPGPRSAGARAARCPTGEGVSFWALGEMVKAEAGILETRHARRRPRRSSARSSPRVCADAADAVWIERRLAPAGRARGATPGRRPARRGVRRLAPVPRGARRASGRRVLVFEDLHWADDGLLDFVDGLVDWATGRAAARRRDARGPSCSRAGRTGAAASRTRSRSRSRRSRIARRPSSSTRCSSASVLPADVQAAVLARAGGNPLYAEEFARLVAERGAARRRPAGARHGPGRHRRPPRRARRRTRRQLLQDAAVVGKVFWPGALDATAVAADELDDACSALERKEFVRRDRRSSVAGEAQYAFRHVLVRDVAYGQIPRAARAERHRACAGVDRVARPRRGRTPSCSPTTT